MPLENSMTASAVPEPMRQLASNLERAIAEKGLSVAAVADRAEIHSGHLCLILRGKRMVQLDTLVKLAGALEVSPGDLLAGVTWVSDGRGGGEFRTHRPNSG
jgi:transcriptional regulator with XRE-family HTH domain